ncbi:tyrosine-protein phosphatase [Sphingomonas ginkgonis]|uniref:Tyrosine-protein phosphatase n=1 Tax=Sphingomonas ginkgonis TaxID=2315330 RepID=A0A3R9WP96_9SPHN|nr:tyrosine-protein phosphatase [Sphingomonas ginkgonis]RST31131.1 tyrosine-protein phosphatase [Sphingomonas ginkgonis]
MSDAVTPRGMPEPLLQGAPNFRDFGGYPSADGRRIRRSVLFRSSHLADLTDRDRAWLDEIGLRTIFDLRSRGERDLDPSACDHPSRTTHVFRPGHKRRLVDMALDYPATEAGVERLMLDFYAELPRTMAHVFGEILVRLADDPSPCIIHCSAGKDRTGMAVALVQAALGASRADMLHDYALTNHVPRSQKDMARSVQRQGSDTSLKAAYPPEAIARMMAADPAYLAAALDAIVSEHGGMDAYLETIGLTAAHRERLRDHLLEPA